MTRDYKARLDREPDRALWLYLYGRALLFDPKGRGIGEALPYFSQAVQREPEFPWARLGLVAAAVPCDGKRDEAQAREQIEAFVRLCPAALEIYAYADDPAFPSDIKERLRGLLEQRADARSLSYYQTLWRGEFRSVPPEQHARLRETVKADLARIRSLDMKDVPDWWLVLASGYDLSGDARERAQVWERMAERFPCHPSSEHHRRQAWDAAHPVPDSADKRSREDYQKARFDATTEWVGICPHSPGSWLYRALAASELASVGNAAYADIVDRFVACWEKPGRAIWVTPSPYLEIAQAYLRKGMRLDLVDSLAQKAVEESSSETESLWIRSRTSIKLGRLEEAEDRLARMRVLLEADGKATDATDESSLPAQQWARYWQGRAELAAARGLRGDALAYYRTALTFHAEDAALEEAARRLWTSLGGTDEGWTALGNVARRGAVTTAEPPTNWERTDAPLRDFALSDLRGRRWTKSQLAGKVAFLNIWATWCGPCKTELPLIQKLNERLEGNPDVTVLTLNVDDNPGLVEPYLQEQGFTFPTLLARDWAAEAFPASGIPRTLLVDRHGIVRWDQIGYEPGQGQGWLEDVLERVSSLSQPADGLVSRREEEP
jgi:thiol-disulfide isomerase/thioredoxin